MLNGPPVAPALQRTFGIFVFTECAIATRATTVASNAQGAGHEAITQRSGLYGARTGGVAMKTLSVIAIVTTLFLIVLTSPPYSRPDTAGLAKHDGLFWVNPDGSRGLIATIPDPLSPQRRELVWVNPDGARGTHDGNLHRSSARDYSWVNPDGSTGHLGSSHARASRSDAAF
jgi:hypothetical protein